MIRRLVLALSLAPVLAPAENFLIQDGEAKAEIVISSEPARSTRLAADELQRTLAKITGATLPIVFAPSGDFPYSIFIGESELAKQKGVTAEGLEAGAYRIVSGDNWLALIGDDTDFVPTEPWAKSNNDIVSGKLQAEWTEAAGYPWGVPNTGLYKHRERGLPADIGLPDGTELPSDARFEFWNHDERGSYNAVCGFLRGLGVRWYLPGDLGEVLPETRSIVLPDIDETTTPDFPIRQFNVRFATADDETTRWFMRLGIRQPYGLMIAHGMHTMTHTDEIRTRHPEWFALYGGKRDNAAGERLNHLCYSNEELFEHTVRWTRAQFDIYDFATVSIMPPDAYIAICQDELCQGKDVPEMGARGKLSNHVWDFANRVAKEVGKTHPDKMILCCAYGANTLPPTNIDKLEPNVQVAIVGGRRPRNTLPEQREEIRLLQEGWKAKTDNRILVFENYPFTDRGWYLPAFTAETIVASIAKTKPFSLGEDIWLSLSRDFATEGIGFNHFQVWFTARSWWKGGEDDGRAMLEEYCRLFYGPAAEEMLRFFTYCEAHWQAMETDAEPVDEALSLFASAKKQAPEGSVFGKRIALIDDFLEELRSKSELLSQKRGPVSKLRTVWEPKEPIVVDGKLDDHYWQNIPASSKAGFSELQTGRRPVFGSSVMAGWDRGGQNLYLGIRCDELPGDEPRSTSTEHDDASIWYGDVVEILLDTDAHSYYQIAVNPAGALSDLDRGAARDAWFRWESQAEVATHVADGHWTIEVRIPVTEDENDPLNQVVGRKPSTSLPWHINICRQRVRDGGTEFSAFSPTGAASFHVPMKFGHFHDGRSHGFEADPEATDYLIESRAIEQQKPETQLDAWQALSQQEGLTEFQQSDALFRAVEIARQKRDLEKAKELAASIPLEAVRATAEMEILLSERKVEELAARFGSIDLSAWPFWQRGAGAFARARALASIGEGANAEADFALAEAFTSDPRTLSAVVVNRGQNRERNLGDEEGALEAYRRNFAGKERIGGSDEFLAVQSAARILSRQGKHEEALATLARIDRETIRGSWWETTLLLRAEIDHAADRKTEAIATLQTLLESPDTSDRVRTTAEEKRNDWQP